jgi:hypothetical protein
MRTTKIILTILSTIFLLSLIAGVSTPQKIHIVEKITIRNSKKEIIDFYKHLNNQKFISPIYLADTTLTDKLYGVDGDEGAYVVWRSKDPNVGSGKIHINKITSDSITIHFELYEPRSAVNEVVFSVDSICEENSLVKYEIIIDLPFPKNLYLLLNDVESNLRESFLDLHLKLLKQKLDNKKV